MELTSKQAEGLQIAVDRYYAKCPYTVIAGYAGTGKSTLIKFIIEALHFNAEDVCYIAYTGKAAEVLRRNGCPNAKTAHQLLYYHKQNADGTFSRYERKNIGKYKMIVVDEVSMLPKDMWNLLLTHHKYILACGDPGQLPPVRSKDGEALEILDTPNIFLDEVMRQAQDNEIIKLSMDIREGKPLYPFKGKDIQILTKNELTLNICNWADQIITATNNKRQQINNLMRSARGFGPEPQPGDKVISLANHWLITDSLGEASLINGTIGYLGECYKNNLYYRLYNFPNPVPILYADFTNEIGEEFGMLNMDYTAITTGNKYLDPKNEYKAFKQPQGAPLEFNYGYAITCHRAQGSQWDKVLVIEENFPMDEEEHRRWLYTAVTRPSEKLVLVLNR